MLLPEVVNAARVFDSVSRNHPATGILIEGALYMLIHLAMCWLFPQERPLPLLSATSFLFAAALSMSLVTAGLYTERAMRLDTPLWRCRLAIASGPIWFLFMALPKAPFCHRPT